MGKRLETGTLQDNKTLPDNFYKSSGQCYPGMFLKHILWAGQNQLGTDTLASIITLE